MSLDTEIKMSSSQIIKDGYEMSVGEILSLYKAGELIINPDFQRFFRWDISKKTKFIESVLLGIPVPPIFVFETDKGIWELVDGLQRLSTLIQFAGILKNEEGKEYPPLVLEGTKLLPSLAGKYWKELTENDPDALTNPQQILVKRARLRIEILKKGSDAQSKYELFQRLNTGGSILSEQEIRNCILVMINKDFFTWVKKLAEFDAFVKTINQTTSAELQQKNIELVLRFLVYRNIPYSNGLDVHEYIDEGMIELASSKTFDKAKEEIVFNETFSLISDSLGANAFKRWEDNKFLGQFLMSSFEVVAIGVSHNIEKIKKANPKDFIFKRSVDLWGDPIFNKYSGAGVRGTSRLLNLLPMSEEFFSPS